MLAPILLTDVMTKQSATTRQCIRIVVIYLPRYGLIVNEPYLCFVFIKLSGVKERFKKIKDINASFIRLFFR